MKPRKLKCSDRGHVVTVVDDRNPDELITGTYRGQADGRRPGVVVIEEATGPSQFYTRHLLRVQ